MQNERTFSLDTMRRCSGNDINDVQYAKFFCDTALSKTKTAVDRLQAIADLAEWGENVRAECETLYGLIKALHQTNNDFIEFFSNKQFMAAPFIRISTEHTVYKNEATKAVETILGWMY